MKRIELKFKVQKLPTIVNLEEVISPFSKAIARDFYYDTPDFKLLKNGNVLRNRDNRRIEFKLDLDDKQKIVTPLTGFQFHLFSNAKSKDATGKIFKTLDLDFNNKYSDFNEFLRLNNFKILAPINKKRRRFKVKDGVHLHLDEVEGLGNFVELEITNSNLRADEVKDSVVETLTKLGAIDGTAEYVQAGAGYVELYLKKVNVPAYKQSKFYYERG